MKKYITVVYEATEDETLKYFCDRNARIVEWANVVCERDELLYKVEQLEKQIRLLKSPKPVIDWK